MPSTDQRTDYLTATTTIDAPPEAVFDALTDAREWWSRNLIGHTADLDDEFVFTDDVRYPGETAHAKTGIRFCRFQLTEVQPPHRLVWHAVDAELTFIDDHREWTGTDVIFEVTRGPEGTELRLTHVGLTAESECFEACSRGWNFFVTTSIPALVTTGIGAPIARYTDVR